jgi:succinylglutamate desuccinylase
MTSSAAEASAALFGSAGGFLAATLAGAVPAVPGGSLALPGGASARRLDEGVVALTAPASRGRAVLSAGVHGNETAPVEILDRLVSALLAGDLVPDRDLLLILGNPPALRRQQRFLTENMNRLFGAAGTDDATGEERQRARRLAGHVAAFLDGARGEPLHLDLHTAIRGSRYRRFAICPDPADSPARRRAIARLGAWGIEAVVLNPGTGSTFSAWSHRACGARSFTLELGSVRPFGANDLEEFRAFSDGLNAWLRGEQDDDSSAGPLPRVFRVTREIYRQTPDFRLHFDDSVANFTAFEAGALLASDGGEELRAAAGEHVLFPNAAVASGQRALLLAEPVP